MMIEIWSSFRARCSFLAFSVPLGLGTTTEASGLLARCVRMVGMVHPLLLLWEPRPRPR